MAILSVLLYTLAVIVAILLICLVLVQPSKGGGFGSAFGGMGESVFGAQTMGHLSKLTVVLIAVFFLVTLGLAAVTGHKGTARSAAAESSVLNSAAAKPAVPAAKPAAPAAKSAAVPAPAGVPSGKK